LTSLRSRSGWTALALLVACAAGRAEAAGPRAKAAIEEARTLINVELKFKEAIELLERSLSEADVTPEDRIEAYRLLGIAYVARGTTDAAEAAFAALLELDPTFELDPLLSPKIHRVFDRVKSKAARIPRILDVRAVPEQDRVVFTGHLADPDELLVSVELYARTGGDAYERIVMTKSGENVEASVPAKKSDGPRLRVEYYVLGKNQKGSPIVRIADPTNPSSIVVDRPLGPAPDPLVPPENPGVRANVEPTSIYAEWWFWAIAIGVIGAGVGTAVILGSRHASPSNGTLDPIRLP
jgi:tetratricopeptide (TPR) repeat protein